MNDFLSISSRLMATIAERRHQSGWQRWRVWGIVGASLILGQLGLAQEAAPTPAAPTPAATATSAATKNEAPALKAGTGGPSAADKVTDTDKLKFEQEQIAHQMEELENRMYRLSESLAKFEPENSSRLRIALKFARQELIRTQMQDAAQLIDKLRLSDAVQNEKDLLAKLERLEKLLLSLDLEFQLKLEQLRTMKQMAQKLEEAIAEEKKLLEESEELLRLKKKAQDLETQQHQLGQLIARQKDHLQQGQQLAQTSPDPATANPNSKANTSATPGDGSKSEAPTNSVAATPAVNAAAKSSGAAGASSAKPPMDGNSEASANPSPAQQLADQQAGTRDDTEKLAKTSKAADNLNRAQEEMAEAVQRLRKREKKEAVANQQAALAALEKELAAQQADAAKLQKEMDQKRFQLAQKRQDNNAALTKELQQMAQSLGQRGDKTNQQLGQAVAKMGQASKGLAGQSPGEAAEAQKEALEALMKAKEELSDEKDQLVDELRKEVRARVMTAVRLMLEKQIVVRQETERLAPKAAEGSRRALAEISRLAEAEAEIMKICSETINLVEETEFAVALPAALQVILDQMTGIEDALAQGEASTEVVAAEKNVEEELQGLLAALEQMPGSLSDRPGQKGQRSRERELNKLVSELKIIRLLQSRVNIKTKLVDADRKPRLTLDDRKKIRVVEEKQTDVYDTMARLIESRIEELLQ